MGASAGSSGAAVHGGVQRLSQWTRPHADLAKPTELFLIDRAGTGHSVPGDGQRSVRRWERKSHDCEGMH